MGSGGRWRMEFRNIKTCLGVESYLLLKGTLLRLSLLPELLGSLDEQEIRALYRELQKFNARAVPQTDLPR